MCGGELESRPGNSFGKGDLKVVGVAPAVWYLRRLFQAEGASPRPWSPVSSMRAHTWSSEGWRGLGRKKVRKGQAGEEAWSSSIVHH